ncbi:FAD-dependent monooxygenase [bacterium]|nr:FAD-dependent monooxygenase [bacterium]
MLPITSTLDVLIVGAGPVGLMLAGQLQRRNIHYRLIEGRGQRQPRSKAGALSPRTLEIFDHLGVLDEVIDLGLFFRAVNTVVAGQTKARVETCSQGGYAALSLSQFDCEEILEADLRRRGGRIERATRLTSLRNTFHFAEAHLEGPAGVEKLICRWVVGCDGSASLARKSLELDGDVDSPVQNFLLGELELDGLQPHGEVWNLISSSDDTPVAELTPKAGGHYHLSLAVPDEVDPSDLDPLELVRQVAGPLLPPGAVLQHLRDPLLCCIRPGLLPSYRHGRVLLAGDAACLQSPLGGRCMSEGLQDAFNLGWKLATVARGEALEGLLATYQEERRNFLDHYRGGPLALGMVPPGDSGAQPGDRMDRVGGLERPYVRRQARLIDLFRMGQFHLVGYGGDWSALADLAERVGHHFGSELRAWAVLPANSQGAEVPEQLSRLYDRQGCAQATWGPGPGAILVRPDGHVGWRGRPQADEDLSRFLSLVSLNY